MLWRKLPGARSAGRVQSVALRLVCDREAEIEAFKHRRILDDRGARSRPRKGEEFPARLNAIAGTTLKKLDIKDEATANAIKAAIEKGEFRVVSVEKKAVKRNPYRAVRHLDAADGRLAQARLLGQADHAGRPAPL